MYTLYIFSTENRPPFQGHRKKTEPTVGGQGSGSSEIPVLASSSGKF